MSKGSRQSPSRQPEAANAGFAEAQASFAEAHPMPPQSRDQFNESVALLRAFNLIECYKARGEVIALARKLARLSEPD